MPTPQRFTHTTRFLALFVTFFTGFTGLVYEVTWHRYLSNLLGSQSQAAAMILAVFLGGLCLGYGVFGRFSKGRSAPTLLRMTGWSEVGIGAFAIIFPSLYDIIWQNIGVVDPSSSASLVVDLFICILLIGVPTVLMGGTLPLLTQGLSENLRDSAAFHAKVYATNTAGAFVGCLSAGFFLIPYLGLPLTMLMTGPVNLLAGVMLLLLAQNASNLSTKAAEHEGYEPGQVARVGALSMSENRGALVAFLAGFTSLTLQAVLIRLVGLTMGSSEYAFSIVVSVFILMIALGAGECGRTKGARVGLWSNQLVVLLGTLLFYLIVPYLPYSAHVARTLLSSENPNFYVFHILMLICLGVILYLPVGGMGRTMPLLFANVRNNFSDLGTCVGRLYGWNTFGCVVGALIGGFIALFYLNFDQILKLVLLFMVIGLVLVSPWNIGEKSTLKKLGLILVPLVLSLGVFKLDQWQKEWLAIGTFRRKSADAYSYRGAAAFHKRLLSNFKLLAYRDDPNTTVAVVEILPTTSRESDKSKLPVRSIWVNGKSDGSTQGSDLRTTRLLAHLPALLSSAKGDSAAVVGFGTGLTVGSLTLYPEISEVHALEISPAVRAFATYFDYRNYSASLHPKVRWHISDAYRVLGSSDKSYSIIVSEPSNPWVAGVERLYTEEFYNIAKDKLEPGGIFAQWFHTYAVSLDTFLMVVNTFSRTFPHPRIFRVGSDVILVGSHTPIGVSVLDGASARFSRQEVHKEFNELGIHTLEALLALELPFPAELAVQAGVHSLDYPKLSFAAGKDFFLGISVEINDFLAETENRPWEALYARRTLLAERIKKSPLSLAALEDVARNNCWIRKLEFPSADESASTLCHGALALLAVQGKLEIDSKVALNEIEILRRLLAFGSHASAEPSVVSKAVDSSEALLALRVFDSYVSPLTDFPVGALKEFISPCFESEKEGIECRTKFVEALALHGHADLALREFDDLQRQLKQVGLSSELKEQRFAIDAAIAAKKSVELLSAAK